MVGLVIFAIASAARRPRHQRGPAARRPGAPGPRRRARLPGRAGADHHDLPGRTGTQPGVRGLRRDVRRRRGGRPDPRRLADRPRPDIFGLVIDGWRLTFLINVPIGLAAAPAGTALPRRVASRTPASSTSRAPSPAPSACSASSTASPAPATSATAGATPGRSPRLAAGVAAARGVRAHRAPRRAPAAAVPGLRQPHPRHQLRGDDARPRPRCSRCSSSSASSSRTSWATAR